MILNEDREGKKKKKVVFLKIVHGVIYFYSFNFNIFFNWKGVHTHAHAYNLMICI